MIMDKNNKLAFPLHDIWNDYFVLFKTFILTYEKYRIQFWKTTIAFCIFVRSAMYAFVWNNFFFVITENIDFDTQNLSRFYTS